MFAEMSALLCRRLHRLYPATPLFRSAAIATSPEARLSRVSPSFPVFENFLTESCSLSPAQAVSAARALGFEPKSRHQPEFVLSLLRSHGFSNAQVTEIVTRWPRILVCKAQVTLAPKLQYLARAGLSTELIAQDPAILKRSLDGYIRPCFEFLYRFLGGADKVSSMIRRQKWSFVYDMKSTIIPNVGFLVELGVAASSISTLMVIQPRVLMMNQERFKEVAQIVRDWGLQPRQKLFIHAMRAVGGLSKTNLATKFDLFESLGWSEEEVISAFQRCPMCLLVSDQKIKAVVSFARTLGLGPSDLSRRPILLMYSFEKRTLPRYAVWRVLASKGLVESTTQKLISMLLCNEIQFLNIYVKRYLNRVPNLMGVYLDKIKDETEVL